MALYPLVLSLLRTWHGKSDKRVFLPYSRGRDRGDEANKGGIRCKLCGDTDGSRWGGWFADDVLGYIGAGGW